MLTSIISWFAGAGIDAIGNQILRYQELKFQAENDEQARQHEETIRRLEAQQEIVIAEQDRAMTSWIRPAFAALGFILWSKLILWDTVLGLGTTPDPGGFVMWFATLIPTAYFVARPFEKIMRK